MKMKSLLLLFGAMLLAISPRAYTAESWATTANQVAFSLNWKELKGKLDFKPLLGAELVAGVEDLGFKEAKFDDLHQQSAMRQTKDKTATWYMVNIPVRVRALGRYAGEIAPAHYVRELQVTAYLLFRKPKSVLDEEVKSNSSQSGALKYYMLKKEITYADIPMKSQEGKMTNGRKVGEAEFDVALFIPLSTACMLRDRYSVTEDPKIIGKGLRDMLVGCAVVATFDGNPCEDYTLTDDPQLDTGTTCNSKIFDGQLANRLSSSKWWKSGGRTKFKEPDVDICSIAETPYAIFHSGRHYPRVKPAFGPAPKGTSSAMDSEEGSAGDSSSSSSSGSKSSGKSDSSTSTSKSTGTTSDYDSEL